MLLTISYLVFFFHYFWKRFWGDNGRVDHSTAVSMQNFFISLCEYSCTCLSISFLVYFFNYFSVSLVPCSRFTLPLFSFEHTFIYNISPKDPMFYRRVAYDELSSIVRTILLYITVVICSFINSFFCSAVLYGLLVLICKQSA